MRYEDINKVNGNDIAIKSIKDYLLPLIEKNIVLRKFDLLKESMNELYFNNISNVELSPLTINAINQVYKDVDYESLEKVCGNKIQFSVGGSYEYIKSAIHVFDNPKLTNLLIDWSAFEIKDYGDKLPINTGKLDYLFAVFERLLPCHLADMISSVDTDKELAKIWNDRLPTMISNFYYWVFREENLMSEYRDSTRRPINGKESYYQSVVDFMTVLKPLITDDFVEKYTEQYIKVDRNSIQYSNILLKDMLSMGYLDFNNPKINELVEARKDYAERKGDSIDSEHQKMTADIERIVLSNGMKKTNLRDKVKIL